MSNSNSNSLTLVWHQVEQLLLEGVSIIPVRDKDEVSNGKTFAAKSAYSKWKKYQSEIISKEELWHEMDRNNTTAIAMVCGKISGNLEIIDIDVKWKPGIDALLFTAIQQHYAELYDRLRIHKTPSGGFHIPYRIIDGEVPGNEKLAGRLSTEEELSKTNGKGKEKNFIETRGEGGYAVAPPSCGYTIHKDAPIPSLTWAERSSLITLCKQFSEVIKVEKTYTPTKYESDYYDEDPFQHFNNSPQAEEVLINEGWKFYDSDSNFIRFTRPGKDTGVSASFNKKKRIYYIFTSSTEFEENKGYFPVNALIKLKFKDDKKKAYRWLVEQGYGKVKARIEEKAVKQRALSGKPLPANFSEQAKQQLSELVVTVSNKYPFGVFWYAEEEEIKINRERFYVVAEGMGFRLYNDDQVCRIVDYRVVKLTTRSFYDEVKRYIAEEDAEEYEAVCNAYESFLQRSGHFTITRLPLLDTTKFLASTKNISYKYFRNCYVRIDGEKITTHTYDQIGDSKVWDELIRPRDFDLITEGLDKGLYYRFLDKAIEIEANNFHVLKCIGYLAHDFKDETMGYIIVLTEQCPDPKQGGGSGKNIFSSLFHETTTFKDIPGSQVQFNEKFLQSWNYERVFSISDVSKKFDFGFLKNLSTGTGIIKKLFKDEATIQPHEMPKLIVSTNFSYEVSDGGLRRRIIPIEFTDFFTRAGGVDTYFNAMFPRDWDEQEYLLYDNLIAKSIHLFLQSNGKLQSPALTHGGWIKQFDQVYGQLTRQFIEENWSEWVEKENVKIEDFNNSYTSFCNENQIGIKYRLSPILMNRALSEWAKEKKVNFKPNENVKMSGLQFKCKVFEEVIPF